MMFSWPVRSTTTTTTLPHLTVHSFLFHIIHSYISIYLFGTYLCPRSVIDYYSIVDPHDASTGSPRQDHSVW